jgi:hypothetical protein
MADKRDRWPTSPSVVLQVHRMRDACSATDWNAPVMAEDARSGQAVRMSNTEGSGRLRLGPAHRRSTHDRWMALRSRKQESAEYRDGWWAEQCGRCRFWVPLSDSWGLDYGACTNAASALDARVVFEHDGCEFFEDAGEWQQPE